MLGVNTNWSASRKIFCGHLQIPQTGSRKEKNRPPMSDAKKALAAERKEAAKAIRQRADEKGLTGDVRADYCRNSLRQLIEMLSGISH